MTSDARGARDPLNAFYDLGADLVDSAAALRASAVSPAAARGAPAVMGCLEAALRDLAEATAALERAASEFVEGGPAAVDESPRLAGRLGRARQGFENLEVALNDAADAAGAARALAARTLSRAPVR